MILKRQEYDEHNRLITTWTPNVVHAARHFSDDWQSDVLSVRVGREAMTSDPGVIVLGDRNQGVYLCNDDGKTIEVLSRLHAPER